MEMSEAEALLDNLRSQPTETEWFEFKTGKIDDEKLGQLISGLSNSAALHGKDYAYLVFGIEDSTHEVVGTNFDLSTAKHGDEDLESWLSKLLNPRINFTAYKHVANGMRVVILEIDPALIFITKFKQAAYIRIGSYNKPLSQNQGKEKALWKALENKRFEDQIVKEGLTQDEVVSLLDVPSLFRLLEKQPAPDYEAMIELLLQEGMVKTKRGMYAITNLGAIMLAHEISKFPTLLKKSPRLVVYEGTDKSSTKLDIPGRRGYALGVNSLIEYILSQLPTSIVTKAGQKSIKPLYPEKAIREFVVNALIHQDLSITGSGPMVEIYSDRVEITNPGSPLIDVRRFIDAEPRSRNEKLSDIMRRMRFCEQLGSGVDNAVMACELEKLPGPKISAQESWTRVILYGPRPLSDMDTLERLNTLYLHAALLYVGNKSMTNESLRVRLNVKKENHSQVSRLIHSGVEVKIIKKKDPYSKSKKYVSYVPYWA